MTHPTVSISKFLSRGVLAVVVTTISIAMASCSSRLASLSSSPPLPATTLQSQLNRFTPQNTQITFIGSALLASHQGTFTQFSGNLDCPDAEPAHASFRVQIQMDSVYTEIPLLTKHLKESDFFDVVKYPVADFTSTRITPSTTSPGDVQITGNLTLHGVTREITFPAHFTISAGVATIDASLTIRQSDFAMQSARITTNEVPVKISAKVLCQVPATGHSDPAP